MMRQKDIFKIFRDDTQEPGILLCFAKQHHNEIGGLNLARLPHVRANKKYSRHRKSIGIVTSIL